MKWLFVFVLKYTFASKDADLPGLISAVRGLTLKACSKASSRSALSPVIIWRSFLLKAEILALFMPLTTGICHCIATVAYVC